MACPTCDHTMHAIGITGGGPTFLCLRCGTFIQYFSIGSPERNLYVPKLVERCRKFRKTRHPSFKAEVGIFGDPVLAAEWERSGIAESINTPENRK